MRTKEETEKLVKDNIDLVWYILRKNFGITINYNSSLVEDMYQEGCIGLYKAAQGFDESKGYKFSTYASKHIFTCILKFKQRYIEKHYDTNKVLYSDKEDRDGLKIADILSTEEDLGAIEIHEILKNVDSYLNDKEKLVLKMRLEGFYQKDIAAVIKSSQVNVSRICKKISTIITKIQNNEEVVTKKIVKSKNAELVKHVKKLHMSGLKYKDIAEELNIPQGSISKYLRAS